MTPPKETEKELYSNRSKIREKIIKVPVEKIVIKEVEKIVEVPVEVIKI